MKRLVKANNSDFDKQIINNEVKLNVNGHDTQGIVYDFNKTTNTVWVDVNEEGYKDTWEIKLQEIKFIDRYLEDLRLEYLANKKRS